MKRIITLQLLALLTIPSYVTAKSRAALPEFTHVECELKPISRPSDHKGTYPYPHVPFKAGTSLNWGGYVAASNMQKPVPYTVNAVSGSWLAPQLAAATQNTYCSVWIGIDGYGSTTAQQIGTEHDWYNGQQINFAWFAMSPHDPYEIVNFPVNNGDSISASVVYIGNDVFILSLFNNTRKFFTVIPTTYTTSPNAQRSCIEWIVEAPYANTVLPLSHFGTVNFNNCSAVINGIIGTINNPSWTNNALKMTSQTDTKKASPGSLTNNGGNFSISWSHE